MPLVIGTISSAALRLANPPPRRDTEMQRRPLTSPPLHVRDRPFRGRRSGALQTIPTCVKPQPQPETRISATHFQLHHSDHANCVLHPRRRHRPGHFAVTLTVICHCLRPTSPNLITQKSGYISKVAILA